MPTSYHQVIHLGRLAMADTDESTYTVENTGVYLQNFGSPGDPLRDHVLEAEFVDGDSDGAIETDNDGDWVGNHIRYDVGFGSEAHALDSLATATIEVTSMDGTTVTYNNVVLFQTTRGDLFLGNSDYAGTDIQTGTGGIQSVNVLTIDTDYNGLWHLNLQSFVCFSAGTEIDTPNGAVRVESLKAGDLVSTLDSGAQPLIWAEQRTVVDLADAKPVLFQRGALGVHMPSQDLVVSPQHRMLIRSDLTRRIFGHAEVFVPAKHLVGLRGVSVMDATSITYVHLLFEQHHVVRANGAYAESLYPGAQAMKAFNLRQILEFASLGVDSKSFKLARTVATGKERDRLLRHHARTGRALVQNVPFGNTQNPLSVAV